MTSEKAAGDFLACLDNVSPLEKGPAYAATSGQPSAAGNPGDWPTFRHDALRSSAATTRLPRTLVNLWEAKLGGPLTAPVVAEGKLFCCTQDDHQVLVLDAANGKTLWSFTAGGRVDSPPTICQGRAVFGCHDGWVYCLRAADGQLAWRFRAAPGERKVVAFGQLESAWPVCGSVLVAGGVAYCVAGRASVLDGGVYAYALDVASGKQLDRLTLHETQAETKKLGGLPEGALSGILTTDGEGIFLGRRRLELSPPVRDVWPAALAAMRPQLFADGGFFDDQWFHRAFWHFSGKGVKASGNLIVFDGKRTFVAAANDPGMDNKSFHIPAGGFQDRIIGTDGRGPSWCANPNLQYGGCLLLASASRANQAADQPQTGKSLEGRQRKAKKGQRISGTPAAGWRKDRFEVMPWAMVSDGATLLVAGPRDEAQKGDPWSTFEGRAGGVLCVLAADTGEVAAAPAIPSPPVWNGMAAARGRLYVALRNGSVICLQGAGGD
jgi:outer membrane protein assembly factor BamB